MRMLSYNLSQAESDEGKFVYSFNTIRSESSEDSSFDITLIFSGNGGGGTTSYIDEPFSPVLDYGVAHGSVDTNLSEVLDGDEEIALASISINEGESTIPGIEAYAPEDTSYDEYVKEVAADIDVFYVMKAQFSNKDLK